MGTSVRTVVLQTARDLHNAGLMRPEELHDIASLCLPDLKPFTPNQIKRLRIRCHASPSTFARILNISVKTVRNWENGETQPTGAALRLLHLLADKGVNIVLE